MSQPNAQSRAARPGRTPCVGICSTTFGDLVCRGCKRFAHEIVSWNGYAPEQRELIWRRLNELREQVVLQTLRVVDTTAFEACCVAADRRCEASAEGLYDVLRALVGRAGSLSEAGLAMTDTREDDALAVLKAIDREIYERSVAHYEHSFRVTS